MFPAFRSNVRIATANVLTLEDPKKFRHKPVAFTSGRLDFLREAFKKNQYHVIGVQETRATFTLLGRVETCFAFVKEDVLAHVLWNYGHQTISSLQTTMNSCLLIANLLFSSTNMRGPYL